jgi:Tfp pilus assembly protein PilX
MMIVLSGKKRNTPEDGIALIVALLMLLLITAALMGMIMMSNTETNVSANFRDEQTAFFASKAGIEEVRDRMRSSATNSLSGFLPTTALPGAPNGILYITNPAAGETVTPWTTTGSANTYPDDEICKELLPCGVNLTAGTWTSQSASTTYAATPILPWKWVRVMAKANIEHRSNAGDLRRRHGKRRASMLERNE